MTRRLSCQHLDYEHKMIASRLGDFTQYQNLLPKVVEEMIGSTLRLYNRHQPCQELFLAQLS